MADRDGTPADPLTPLEALTAGAQSFDFFQALRRIECAFRSAPRLGTAARPADEPVRLAQEPSLAFAPAAVSSFVPAEGGRSPRLTVLFQGLFGPNGPLPLHLTDYARDRGRNHGDPTLSRFADVFHHRLLLFFYRAWAQARPTVSADRPGADRFESYVGALFGATGEASRGRDAMPDRAKLYYSGLLAAQVKNRDSLVALVTDHLGIPARVEEYVGEWTPIAPSSQWRLGPTRQPGILGQSATLGARAWLCQHKFRIVLGPLTEQQHADMLPGGTGMPRLSALVRTYVGDELRWDVKLLLHRAETVRLGRAGHLGWSAFLGTAGKNDPGEVILEPEPAAQA